MVSNFGVKGRVGGKFTSDLVLPCEVRLLPPIAIGHL